MSSELYQALITFGGVFYAATITLVISVYKVKSARSDNNLKLANDEVMAQRRKPI